MYSIFLTLCFTGIAYASHVPAYNHPPAYGPHAPAYPKQYCDPKQAPACSNNVTNYCLTDDEYPVYEIKHAISQDPLFAKKYSDVAKQSAEDLVDDISGPQEAAFDYKFYTGQSKGATPYDGSHWMGPEGYNCPSDVVYGMPRRAKNVAGEWRVIVNEVGYYTQTLRVETCLFPDSACRLVPLCIKNKCTQKYIYHRLLSFDPCDSYKGLFIDVYRFPSACSCHIQ